MQVIPVSETSGHAPALWLFIGMAIIGAGLAAIIVAVAVSCAAHNRESKRYLVRNNKLLFLLDVHTYLHKTKPYSFVASYPVLVGVTCSI